MPERYDALAIGAHPDDVEVFMGGTRDGGAPKGLIAGAGALTMQRARRRSLELRFRWE